MAGETNRDRAERYLKMATETASAAKRSADPAAAEAYMHLAAVWMKMADDLLAPLPANDESNESDSEARA